MELSIAFLIGALIPTFLVSRLLLWVSRSWDGGVVRLATVHAVSWLVAAFIGGLGMANGGVFAGVEAAVAYFIPQAVWFTVDIIRHKRRPCEPKATQISN